MNTRGQYGARGKHPPARGRALAVGSVATDVADAVFGPAIATITEVSDAELREAVEAGNRASRPLEQERDALLRRWPAELPLTSEQLHQIMNAALKTAFETASNLTTLIAKVPGRDEWLSPLRNERRLLESAISQEPKFRALVATTLREPGTAAVVPGFRDWIRQLLTRSADGVTAIGFISHILPDWIYMRELVSTVYRTVVALISGIVEGAKSAGGAALDLLKQLPSIAKVAGIGVLAIGGVWALSKLVSATRSTA